MVSAKKLCYVAVLTALTVVLSSFSIPTPVGAHVYLTDAAIIFAGLVLDPLSAFIVGGVGAFIGDAIFYPAAMFVSLFTHGAQAVAVSLIAGGVRKFADDGEKDDFKNKTVPAFWKIVLAGVAGCVIMAGGYAFGNACIYGGTFADPNWGVAIAKIPFELLQSGVGAVIAPILAYKTPLKKVFFAVNKKKEETQETPPEENSEKN